MTSTNGSPKKGLSYLIDEFKQGWKDGDIYTAEQPGSPAESVSTETDQDETKASFVRVIAARIHTGQQRFMRFLAHPTRFLRSVAVWFTTSLTADVAVIPLTAAASGRPIGVVARNSTLVRLVHILSAHTGKVAEAIGRSAPIVLKARAFVPSALLTWITAVAIPFLANPFVVAAIVVGAIATIATIYFWDEVISNLKHIGRGLALTSAMLVQVTRNLIVLLTTLLGLAVTWLGAAINIGGWTAEWVLKRLSGYERRSFPVAWDETFPHHAGKESVITAPKGSNQGKGRPTPKRRPHPARKNRGSHLTPVTGAPGAATA